MKIVTAHKKRPKKAEIPVGRHPAGPGGPQTGTCGTCGHHKGRKTFHPSCPRLGELIFKGGTKSAKVLMEETQQTPCGYWTETIPIPGLDYGPFNTWQMKNCASCSMPSPCELRRHRLEEFERGRGLDPKFQCPEKKPNEKPNCGGKRPAINRCPDDCPDRSCEKEGGYPQGRCKQTGQKLREMQVCPNDPPKKSASKKSKPRSEAP